MKLLIRLNNQIFPIEIQISGFSWKTWVYMLKNWITATSLGSSLLTKSTWSHPVPYYPLNPLTHIYSHKSDSRHLWLTLLTFWAATAVAFIMQPLHCPKTFSGVMGVVHLWAFTHSKARWDPPWCFRWLILATPHLSSPPLSVLALHTVDSRLSSWACSRPPQCQPSSHLNQIT